MVANLDPNSFKIALKTVTANKTLDLTDTQSRQLCTNTTPVTITVPLNATVSFSVGTFVYIEKVGTGTVSIATDVGVTIANHQGALTSPQSVLNQGLLIKVGSDSWLYLRLPDFTQFSEPLAKASTAAAHRLLVHQENIFADFNASLTDLTTVLAIGPTAGKSNVSGPSWTAVGASAGKSNVSGSYWTAVGASAGASTTTAGGWTAVGASAGTSNETGENWTAVGASAGFANVSGSNWVAVGRNTAGGITTGSGNTVIGANIVGLPAALANNVILGSGDGVIKIQCDSTGICTLQSGLRITTTSAALTRQFTATKAIVTPSTTDTITVTGAALGDLVAVSRGSNPFVSAVNTVTFNSTGLAGVTVRAVVTRYTA